MEFKVTGTFLKSLKKLIKKHKDIKEDILRLTKDLSSKPESGIRLGSQMYKIRLNITKSSIGKRGGLRIIYYFKISASLIVYIDIYSKNEKESIPISEIKQILIDNNLIDLT
jgi:mRNA-degrading endonuclease RelE of RelBE toxin-antitoxin system